jgi:quinol monooxygenase YgiN
MRAVATFTYIAPENLAEFKSVAAQMLKNIQEQESILRYDMFFTQDSTKCVVLEEFSSPEGVLEHVKRNAALLDQLVKLGGNIEGSVFPINEDGPALDQIKNTWDSAFHIHFAGKSS